MLCAKIKEQGPEISRSDQPIDGPPSNKSRSPGIQQHRGDAGVTITAGGQNHKSP
jgi:hypothetical protein